MKPKDLFDWEFTTEELHSVRSQYYNTPMRVIRQKCLECSCWNTAEVKECPTVNCALWEYRSGKGNRKLNLSDEEKKKRSDRMNKAREVKNGLQIFGTE